MQKYGILKDGNLLIVDEQTEGAKPVVFSPMPEFDQTMQYIVVGDVAEHEESISVDYAIEELVSGDDAADPEEAIGEFVKNKPWVDPGENPKNAEVELLKAQNKALVDRAEFVEELIFEMALQVYQ